MKKLNVVCAGLLALGLMQMPAMAADASDLPTHTLRPADQQLQALLERQDYRAAAPLITPLLAKPAPTADERALIYTWLFARDDMAEVDRRSRAGHAAVDDQAAGRIQLELHELDAAQQKFQQALDASTTANDKAAALRGLGLVAFQRRDFDLSLTLLEESIHTLETADALAALNETLIRLGRTDDAITAAQQAVKLNPYQEFAHYQLGNGYTRKNYTQLAADYGHDFDAAMALVKKASDAFNQARFDTARDLSFQALRLCPELGRAHAILARSLESQRLLIDVHRADYERRFAAAPMPQVPGIERYVSNWADLSPRIRKRVAMSVAPWKAYIPILVEGGSHLFIKPMAMKLSETPGGASLKDARIEYDSRLWDDVRGAGGYSTVTGIEDVERTIFDRYNTVTHELTHQVHGVMTADQWREIQDLYRRAKERDAKTKNGFLSRYAGGSVWEYFAEGANAFVTPRRDAYDPREMVRERLQAIDPDLLALEARLLAQTDVSASLPIAYVKAGENEMVAGHLEPALEFFDRAAKIAPDDESVLGASLFAHAVKGDGEAVRKLVGRVARRYPDSGVLLTAAVDATWHTGEPLESWLGSLSAGMQRMSGDDRFRVGLALAEALRKLGKVQPALQAYDAVLALQADSPEALWGKASTLALDKRWDEAFALYGQVLRLRTGLVALRADMIRDQLRAGRVDEARAGLKEAQLLDPKDPTLLALDAWLSLVDKDAAGAVHKADLALEQGPWCDLALIVKAAALREQGQAAAAVALLAPLNKRLSDHAGPEYVYRADQSSWISVHELPAEERGLMQGLN